MVVQEVVDPLAACSYSLRITADGLSLVEVEFLADIIREAFDITKAGIIIEKDLDSPTIGQFHYSWAGNFYSCLIIQFQRQEVVTGAQHDHFVCFPSQIGHCYGY